MNHITYKCIYIIKTSVNNKKTKEKTKILISGN